MDKIEEERRPSALTRHRLTLIAAACVILYAGFLQYVWGWSSLIAEWHAVGYGTVALAMLLLVSTYFVRAYRLYDYFPSQTKGRFVEVFHVTQVHNILNIMLPFRSGETSFPLLMRSEFGVGLLHGTAALLVMRLLDLHALLAAGGLGLVLQGNRPWLEWPLWIAFLAAPLVAFFIKGPLFDFALRKSSGKPHRILESIREGLPADAGVFVRAWVLTIVNWGTKVLVFAWCLRLLGVFPIAASFGGALGGELSSVLPLHAPAGVGTYPSGIAAGALLLGADRAAPAVATLAKASVNMHLIIIVSALMGAALSILMAHGKRRLAAGA
ncbi:lysylphosphatidylglycerol synthase domain-containing protein [Rhizobium sp. LC145]|uniref:lysylphosphatidylglycerol synthase domain-containing protein n=1 Tax=Rhizobium sp. LC145 TaxID=1120688 RepID=UPI00062A3970|nr:lysylphosphatidylglycerol synthase domain-containing protein [Rhizobium sp. LC145]KKX28013.1 membrane protein [Rhizobium sp. LC145]TKT46322.1 UPF0104 family protein [Rhizobiaceae bacterium LC148]